MNTAAAWSTEQHNTEQHAEIWNNLNKTEGKILQGKSNQKTRNFARMFSISLKNVLKMYMARFQNFNFGEQQIYFM